MCGICGFITRKKISKKYLDEMNTTMYHRGPDDEGEEIYDIGNGMTLGFAHRRLAILDLSEAGHQPMHSEDQRIIVVFNGEIYNFQELKKELFEYPFASECDTEVIIAAYLRWGKDFVQKLNGMFAIALYDRKDDVLYLYRDRIGKKPLYYFLDTINGKVDIVFSSELKPILVYPYFHGEIRKEVLAKYLFHQYICGEESVFQNVYKLAPGMCLCYKRGRVSREKYWDVTLKYHEKNTGKMDYESAKTGLKDLLEDCVKKRMISDVPLGTFLSGGYDSSLITAVAQSLSGQPIKTFCIGFPEKEYNEAEYAKQISKYLGTDHTEMYITKEDMVSLVDSIPEYYDEPFADDSQIPSMLVSRLAKEQVTVVLSGDGGDELFCGYTKYAREPLAQKLDKIGSIIRRTSHLPFLKSANMTERLPYQWRTIVNNEDAASKTQYGCLNYIPVIMKMLGADGKNQKIQYDERKYHERDWQKRAMLLDQETYLPDDNLCKVDRATMKYSLEARCPFLDYRLVEYSYRIPHKYKYFRGDKKHILKEVAYDYIPRELLERPKKGFGTPIDEWLRGILKDRLLDYSEKRFLRNQGIFDSVNTSRYVREYLINGDGIPGKSIAHSRIVWAFFVFQMWWERYCS